MKWTSIWLTIIFLALNIGTAQAQVASYYSYEVAGRKTANGETFNPRLLTAAHPTLKFGTIVKVRNMANNKSVIVRINDRGPYIAGRNIDLSLAAAKQIDMIKTGVAEVEIVILA